MLARTLILSLTLTAAVGLPDVSAQREKQPQPVRTHTVFYREEGAKDWSLFGYYETMGSAQNVFEHLERGGYQVKLEITNTPIPKTQSLSVARSAPVKLPDDETVTLAKATQIFQAMIKQDDIAFRYPVDGCYARAELMIERMARQGLKPRKVWAVANGNELVAKTKNHPKGFVTWGYHVAPVLRVRIAADKQLWYVIDPSLFDRPVTIREWRARMKRPHSAYEPYSTVTPLGQAPKDPRGVQLPGSGYWAGRDPADVDEHAVNVMRLYKQKEFRAELHRPFDLSPSRLDLDDPRRLFALAA